MNPLLIFVLGFLFVCVRGGRNFVFNILVVIKSYCNALMACVKAVKILEENDLAGLQFHTLIEFHSYVMSSHECHIVRIPLQMEEQFSLLIKPN